MADQAPAGASGPSPPVALAPQPGSLANKEADSGDAALIFILSLGKFFASIFKMSILAYCFWVGMLYVVGATLILVGFHTLSPSIDGVPACPAKQSGYLLTTLWYLLAVINIATAYGYLTIQSMGIQEFEHLTGYMQAVGFMTKVVPSYSRLIHVFNLCQLNVMAIQILFLPECNRTGLVIVFGFVLMIWWSVVIFGVWAKQRIFVPPFLYSPLRPGKTFLQEVEKMMHAFGP